MATPAPTEKPSKCPRTDDTRIFSDEATSHVLPVCQHCEGFLCVLHTLWLCQNLESKRGVFFRGLFQQHIFFHPVFLLGKELIVRFKKLLQIIYEAGFLRGI